MTKTYSSVAVATFENHDAAEAAVKQLIAAGFAANTLSVVGKGYHTEDKVAGFYNTGDRVKFWGKQGAAWGALWGALFGGLFITVPVTGPVLFLGYLGAVALSAVETAVVVGAAGAIGGAIASIGIPKDSVLNYESVIKADGFIVMAHGDADTVAKARTLLQATAKSVEIHTDLVPADTASAAA
ncbi:MAG: general stress protein [Devosia sp.]